MQGIAPHFLCIVLVGGLAAALTPRAAAAAGLRLPALLGDNAVLQRSVTVPLWGYGPPGARVTVAFAGQSRSAVVAADGRWSVRLAPMAAGGPHALTVSTAGESLVARNVLVGDVWVASGQSNMVWPLVEARDGAAETARADVPGVRLFSVPRTAAAMPQEDCGGRWSPCTPDTAGGFSAVAYYFGRELHRHLGVPIGLIQSDVGGTPAESWCAPEWLKGKPHYADLIAKVPPGGASARVAHDEYMQTMNDWYLAVLMKDPGNEGERQGWHRAGLDTAGWGRMHLPGAWETNDPALQIDGAVWFRRSVTVPQAWDGRDLVLNLGTIADHDVTYFDGEQVGKTAGAMPLGGVRRAYRIPGRLVRAGERSIAVRVWNQIAAGGLTGVGADMSLELADKRGEALPLAGAWQFRVETSRDAAGVPPMPPPPTDGWTAWSTGGLYNAMVAPLTRHAIKGVIWYQGESNVGRAGQYRRLFPDLIRGWRRAWSQGDFPFLFVQLANFQQRRPLPGESDWADLRDAQTAALRLPRTGMAVAIDVGDAADIHPKNKLDVGRRLALAARRVAYSDTNVSHSGPQYDKMAVRSGAAVVRFRHAADGLTTTDGGPVRGFAVAGPDGRYVWAEATIVGQTLAVSSAQVVVPVAVRYAWADNPDCNLCNSAGLPAVPFSARVRGKR